jgi:hypothetical protein
MAILYAKIFSVTKWAEDDSHSVHSLHTSEEVEKLNMGIPKR